jgi:hypothetical protein
MPVTAKAQDSAADKRLTSRSDYIRIALLDRLRADGNDPAPAASSSPDLSAPGAPA